MKKRKLLAAGLAAVALGAGSASAQSSRELAALNKRLAELEKKTSRLEAENRQLLDREIKPASSSADKIKLAGGVSELKLSGDLRLRYQYDTTDTQHYTNPNTGRVVNDHGSQRSRWRFRLRVNADFKLGDNWFAGIGLQTGQSADSGFETYTGGFSNYNVYLSRAFVGWNAADWFTLVAGKQANPFYKTELVWGSDLSPTGLSQRVQLDKLFGGDSFEETITGYDKDGKPIVSSTTVTQDSPWELALVFGQFIFSDNNEAAFGDTDLKTDAYLFEQQLIFGYKFSKDLKVTFAPSFLLYNAANIASANNAKSFSAATAGAGFANIGHTRDLHILQFPGDVTFKLFGQRTKFVWDVAYNASGGKRTHDIYGVVDHNSHDDWAFLVGLEVGQNRKKGDWSASVNYRQVGLSAIDPNLNDSTWAHSHVNVRGWKAAVAYNFTDNVLGAITYTQADNLRNDLFGGQATGGAKLADLNNGQALQVDLNVKF